MYAVMVKAFGTYTYVCNLDSQPLVFATRTDAEAHAGIWKPGSAKVVEYPPTNVTDEKKV